MFLPSISMMGGRPGLGPSGGIGGGNAMGFPPINFGGMPSIAGGGGFGSGNSQGMQQMCMMIMQMMMMIMMQMMSRQQGGGGGYNPGYGGGGDSCGCGPGHGGGMPGGRFGRSGGGYDPGYGGGDPGYGRGGLQPVPNGRGLNSGAMPDRVRRWEPLIHSAAQKYGVPPAMIAAVMMQESGGNPNAGSHAGARGLMQFMPRTFADVTRRHGISGSITDPAANIEAGAAHLKELYNRYGNWQDVLVAYNAGPGRVGRPLPAETRNYIPAVMNNFRRFSAESAIA